MTPELIVDKFDDGGGLCFYPLGIFSKKPAFGIYLFWNKKYEVKK